MSVFTLINGLSWWVSLKPGQNIRTTGETIGVTVSGASANLRIEPEG